MIVGCYDLNLYCDVCRPTGGGLPMAEYTGYDRAECYRDARKDGWIISNRKQTCTCPDCRIKRASSGDKT
jgi:hypothetical protein